MKIKVCALLMNHEDKGEIACVLDCESLAEGQTFSEFVTGIQKHGLFLNNQKTDWIPSARVLRVWVS
jgi:hypothetical protein